MKAYLIPGLGFDERTFRNLNIDKEFEIINWIEPFRNENIQSYAKRLIKNIDIEESKIVLIGHSFGGIMCQEIAAIIAVKKIILVSSIKDKSENPFHFRIIKAIRLYKLFSKELTAKTINFWGSKYDYVSKSEIILVKDMVNNHSNHYLQWALKQLSIWKKPKSMTETNLIQIHGELDRTFPITLIKKLDHIIKNSGHFMIYKKSRTIEKIINRELNSI